MKASFRLILAALAATAALVGCTKEITPNFENDKVAPAAEGTRVIAVSFASQTKTILDGFQPKFANKDSILISNGEALDTCEVKVDGKGATITTNLTGPLTAVYPYKAAKMSEGNENEIDTVLVSTVQSGKFADANICMAKMTSENDESLSFDNKTAVFCITPGAGESTQYVEVSAKNFDIANCYQTESAYTSFETIHVATTTADSVYVSILVPEGLTVGSLSFSDGTNVKTIKDERASTAIAAGTLYTVTNANWESTEADIPEPLKGKFSVSANKQVYFSQGNLVATINATGTPTDWKFATNQYDYIGGTVANTSIGNTSTSGTAGDVDLFGWSTSTNGGTSTTDNYGIKTSTSTSDYSGEFYDWGKAIGDGNTWRTLSTAEWQYLFNSRSTTTNTGTTNARYAKATVNSKAGIILLPDAYTHPSVVTALTNINTNNAAFTVNTYDVTAWEAMESAGAVFLPAAGYRYGSNVYNVGRLGFYWSSTANGSSSAYLVNFNSSNVSPDYSDVRYYGSSVRLVTDVSAAPTPTAPAYVEITAKYDGEDQPARALKWATKNLGADNETDYGDYYAWGTTVKAYSAVDYSKTTGAFTFVSSNPYGDIYKAGPWDATNGFAWINTPFTDGVYSNDNKTVLTKYVPENMKATYGDGGIFYDDKIVLDPDDDVAHKVLGGNWRMPTKEEFDALCNLTKEWKTNYNNSGVNGYLFSDENDHSIFLPAAGWGNGTDLLNAGGSYWSSSLDTGDPNYAYYLGFSDGYADTFSDYRYFGQSIRPVSE